MANIDPALLLDVFRYAQFSPNFRVREFFYSNVAIANGIANISYDRTVWFNLKSVSNFLEVLRSFLKFPIYINSGYRCPEVNSLVGGVSTSLHLKGLAVDIQINREPIEYYKAALDSSIKKFKNIQPEKYVTYYINDSKKYIHIQLNSAYDKQN